MRKIKNFIDKLNSFIDLNNGCESIDLEQAIKVLEQLREIKHDLEDISQELNSVIIDTFKALKINELSYQEKIIKLRYVTNYYFDKLIEALDKDTKEKLVQYLEPRLSKKIVERAIIDKVLPIRSLEELVDSGLVEKQTRYFLKFKGGSPLGEKSLETMR